MTNPLDSQIDLSEQEQQLMFQARDRILLFSLGGPMSFGAAKAISQSMGIVKKYEVLILDMTEVPKIGVTAALAIENMIKEALSKQNTVFLVGVSGQVRIRLDRLGLLQKLQPHQQALTRLEALKQAVELINPQSESAVEETR